ncbi:unnamed protein product [Pleuronectes platessa]|uniref:Uncharacterized protein n=1 Tax=Pleuronectes platessa TaxID=8262 RepID=A0A9N7YUF3_PLEPL|nr:unnamed protein product [Pleuronectes platessa]
MDSSTGSFMSLVRHVPLQSHHTLNPTGFTQPLFRAHSWTCTAFGKWRIPATSTVCGADYPPAPAVMGSVRCHSGNCCATCVPAARCTCMCGEMTTNPRVMSPHNPMPNYPHTSVTHVKRMGDTTWVHTFDTQERAPPLNMGSDVPALTLAKTQVVTLLPPRIQKNATTFKRKKRPEVADEAKSGIVMDTAKAAQQVFCHLCSVLRARE